MELFLVEGQSDGKIVCPNKKCNAKLGNYDWAGVCCGCREWVTPVYIALLTLLVDLTAFFVVVCRGSVSIGQKWMKLYNFLIWTCPGSSCKLGYQSVHKRNSFTGSLDSDKD